MVFTANAAVVRGKKAYLANFHYEERKGERHFYEKWLRSNGFETLGSVDFPFEGKWSCFSIFLNFQELEMLYGQEKIRINSSVV